MAGRRRKIAFVFALLAACNLVASPRQDRAADILSAAREAVGGPGRLNAVTALTLKAAQHSDLDGSGRLLASLEVDVMLPDKFLISREWSAAFTSRIGGFNGTELLEQSRESGADWADTRLGDARKDGRAFAIRARELLRYLIAWLLAVPEQYHVRFSDGGAADSGLGPADVLEAKGAYDFAARLFFDRQTHRLTMITYREPPARAADSAAAPKSGAAGAPLFNSLEMPEEKDIKMLLMDYRRDDGILFPHKVKFEVESLSEDWAISRFKVNPRFEPNQFARRR